MTTDEIDAIALAAGWIKKSIERYHEREWDSHWSEDIWVNGKDQRIISVWDFRSHPKLAKEIKKLLKAAKEE